MIVNSPYSGNSTHLLLVVMVLYAAHGVAVRLRRGAGGAHVCERLRHVVDGHLDFDIVKLFFVVRVRQV